MRSIAANGIEFRSMVVPESEGATRRPFSSTSVLLTPRPRRLAPLKPRCAPDWSLLLAFRLGPGVVFMLLATISWAFYSWLLSRTSEPARIRGDWAAFLMAQMVFGLAWSGSFAGVEWAMGHTHIAWGWPLIAALAFIAVGPAVLAYRCWGVGVERAGPAVAGFFVNLTPLFAGILSAAFLGETPQLFHGVAFALIVGGIVVSSRR